MELLQAGVDCSVIALWLGHESVETTQAYLHAHLEFKEAALAKLKPYGPSEPASAPATACSPSSRRCKQLDYAEWNRGDSHAMDCSTTRTRERD